MRVGYARNNQFKTEGKYHYQVVYFVHSVKNLLKTYIKILRPRVAPPNAKADRNDFLFLNFGGKADEKAPSRCVTNFFQRVSGLNINCTAIRGLVETDADSKFQRGEITEADRNAICYVNGHTPATARQYYIKQRVDDEQERARRVMGYGEEGEERDDAGTLTDAVFTPMAVEQWGSEHPDRGKVLTRKAQWSQAEKNYLANTVEEIQREGGGMNERFNKNLMAECLRRIRADPNSRAIFHQRHIANSARLRSGYRQSPVALAAEAASVTAAAAIAAVYLDIENDD